MRAHGPCHRAPRPDQVAGADFERQAKRDESDQHLEQKNPAPARQQMRAAQRHFCQQFMIDPGRARRRPGVRLHPLQVAGEKHALPDHRVRPQVGVRRVLGKLVEGQREDEGAENAFQNCRCPLNRHPLTPSYFPAGNK